MPARPTTIRASAPGKLLLLGEYAVLEGATAIVTAVNRRAVVSLDAAGDQGWKLTAPQLGLSDFLLGKHGSIPAQTPADIRNVLGLFASVLHCVFEHAGPLAPHSINIDTSAFFHSQQKLGIGSSAAVAVALTGVLLAAHGRESNRGELFALAAQAHNRAQNGVGSNVDIAASVYGGTLVHRIDAAPVATEIPTGLTITPVFTGRAASTQNLIGNVFRLRKESPEIFSRHMQAMTQLALAGCSACQQDNASEFLRLAGAYHSAMQALGEAAGADIISDAHTKIHEIAAQSGVAYKPSGAGGGDIGLLFYPAPKHVDSLILNPLYEALAKLGFKTLTLELRASGFKVM